MSFAKLPISRVADVELGKMLKTSPSDGDVLMPYLRAAHVQPGGRLIDLGDEQRMYFSPKEAAALTLKAGDMVVVEGGAGYGRSAVLERDYDGWAFQNSILRVRPRPGRADARFLSYALRTALDCGEIDLFVNTATIPHFTAEKVSRFVVPMPAAEQQGRIADYLDRETATIDALIAKQVELMNRLRERRQAVIDRAFVSTSEIVILRRHLVLNDSGAWGEDPTGADDVAVLRSTEQTVDGYWAISDPALRTLSQTERQNTRLRAGDLIVTKTSGSFKHVGKTTLVDNEVAEGGYGFGNFMQRLRLKSTMTPKFLWWFMRTDQARSWINLVATTSTGLMNLNGSTLGRMEVPLPSLVEQREIVGHLDRETAKIDALIARAERFIELAQERRAALITAAVTGQIEIPTED